MANCPKCNAIVEKPLKSWKIKQTTMALYECASCKAKWRGKQIIQSIAASPMLSLETSKTNLESKALTVIPEVKADLQVVTPKPSSNDAVTPTVNAFSGIRRSNQIIEGFKPSLLVLIVVVMALIIILASLR